MESGQVTGRQPDSVRLLRRLRDEGIIPAAAPACVIPIRAGRAAKVQGAWAWTVHDPDTFREFNVGSQFTMRQCVRARRWDVSTVDGDTHIDPSPEDRRRFAEARLAPDAKSGYIRGMAPTPEGTATT